MAIDRFIKTVCVQPAVYWEARGVDKYGNRRFKDPVEILCRWEEKTKLVVDARGKDVVSGAQVLLNDTIQLESMIRLGTLSEVNDMVVDDRIKDTRPESVPGVWEVVSAIRTPMIRSKDVFVNIVYLGR